MRARHQNSAQGEALELDRNYAAPHRLLSGLYRTYHPTGADPEAERRIFLARVPQGAECRTPWLNHH